MKLNSLVTINTGDFVSQTIKSIIAVLNGQESMCIELVESQKRHHACSHLGERVPLHCTAGGKILLAFNNINVNDLKLEQYTPNTIIQSQILQEHLRKVKKVMMELWMEFILMI